jgi:hypothetical protein
VLNEPFTMESSMESGGESCHGPHMDSKGRYNRAGGSILAISIIAGTVGGVIAGQSSIGFLVGTGAGLLLVALIWLKDRKA